MLEADSGLKLNDRELTFSYGEILDVVELAVILDASWETFVILGWFLG